MEAGANERNNNEGLVVDVHASFLYSIFYGKRGVPEIAYAVNRNCTKGNQTLAENRTLSGYSVQKALCGAVLDMLGVLHLGE